MEPISFWELDVCGFLRLGIEWMSKHQLTPSRAGQGKCLSTLLALTLGHPLDAALSWLLGLGLEGVEQGSLCFPRTNLLQGTSLHIGSRKGLDLQLVGSCLFQDPIGVSLVREPPKKVVLLVLLL